VTIIVDTGVNLAQVLAQDLAVAIDVTTSIDVAKDVDVM